MFRNLLSQAKTCILNALKSDICLYENGDYLTWEDVFKNERVFEALDFAFRNADTLGIDENSETYRQIQRAYWAMPVDWCMERQSRAQDHCVMSACAEKRK
jgi:hypothetical protein